MRGSIERGRLKFVYLLHWGIWADPTPLLFPIQMLRLHSVAFLNIRSVRSVNLIPLVTSAPE